MAARGSSDLIVFPRICDVVLVCDLDRPGLPLTSDPVTPSIGKDVPSVGWCRFTMEVNLVLWEDEVPSASMLRRELKTVGAY